MTAPALPFTGERFVPGTPGEIWVEHWHRYHFAARWAAGKRVLDVACGEGYGSAGLALQAAHVTGVDVSEAAIAHARAAYAGQANLEFLAASCTALPLPAASFDAVVSFETIEHIEGQEAFLGEVARVLRPEGVFVLSCPNKVEYSDKRNYANEFHVKELYRDELEALVRARFPHIAWHGQRPSFFSVIAREGEAPARGELFDVTEAEPATPRPALSHPLYYLLVASRDAAALDALPPAVSVLADRDEWVYRDYAKVIRELREAVPEVHRLREALAQNDVQLAAARRELDAAKQEMARRQGLRWWLKEPLYRLGILQRPPV